MSQNIFYAILDKIVSRKRVIVEHHDGFGADTMKLTFSKTGTCIKLNTKVVSKETIKQLLKLIKYHEVNQCMRSGFIKITSIVKPTYIVKLYGSTRNKWHLGNYNATKNEIVLIAKQRRNEWKN